MIKYFFIESHNGPKFIFSLLIIENNQIFSFVLQSLSILFDSFLNSNKINTETNFIIFNSYQFAFMLEGFIRKNTLCSLIQEKIIDFLKNFIKFLNKLNILYVFLPFSNHFISLENNFWMKISKKYENNNNFKEGGILLSIINILFELIYNNIHIDNKIEDILFIFITIFSGYDENFISNESINLKFKIGIINFKKYFIEKELRLDFIHNQEIIENSEYLYLVTNYT